MEKGKGLGEKESKGKKNPGEKEGRKLFPG